MTLIDTEANKNEKKLVIKKSKGVGKLRIAGATNPQEVAQQTKAFPIKFKLEVLQDGRVGLITNEPIRMIEILRAALSYTYYETRRKYDEIKATMEAEGRTQQEVENLLYGLIVHDIVGTQLTMFDLLQSIYPESNSDVLDQKLRDSKEALINFAMDELNKSYEKDGLAPTTPSEVEEDLSPME